MAVNVCRSRACRISVGSVLGAVIVAVALWAVLAGFSTGTTPIFFPEGL